MTHEAVRFHVRGISAPADEACKPLTSRWRHPRTRTQWMGIISLAASLAFLTACSKKVQAPDVKGLTTDKAGPMLTTAQLKVGKITCAQGEVLPTAKILTQTPVAGESVAPDTTVDLVVENSISVPNLVGTGAADAMLALQNAGLKSALNKKTEFTHWGAVIQQDISPGTMVGPNTAVTLTVATPPDMAMFQDLITKQPAYAKLSQKERDLMDQLFK